MDLDRFLSLPSTVDGRPVVTLLADPTMKDAGGAPVGFLSLVPAGANGRTFTATKADLALGTPAAPAPLAAEPAPWWRSLFGALFGGVQVAKDAGDPVDFDQAMTVEKLRRARWEATDALWEVIGNILEAPEVTDKAGAIAVALQRFSAHVLGLVTASLAMKSEDRAALGRELAQRHQVAKAGRVISAANMAKLATARDALGAAAAALSELLALGGDTVASKAAEAATNLLEDPSMLTPAQIEALAVQASTNAITVAKGAGLTDPAKLAQVGADAFAAVVAKVAPSGPAQPAMPQDILAQQMAASGGMGGTMGAPMADIAAALRALPGMVAKVDTLIATVAKLDQAINGSGEGAARQPGVVELAEKSAELATATAERVAKIAPIPAPPRGSSDPETPPVQVAKAADGATDWSDSPFGGFTKRPARA
jgi:hypothetical protein